MLFASLIASLVLLESRYVFHGFLSQPFFVSILLAATGHDPAFVFLTAAVVHLIYIDKKPSGASLFPEYPFAYFIVVFSNRDRAVNTVSFILSLLLILLFSKVTAQFIRHIRQFLEKRRDRLMFKNSYPDMPRAFLISFSILILYSVTSLFIADNILKILSMYGNGSFIKFGYERTGAALCLIFTLKYAISNIRLKYA